MTNLSRTKGFTLLEILVALFIFSILSLILAGGLRSVINAQSGSERSAERLRQLQFALLVLSRDVEQAVNRPVIAANGKEEGAFIGTPTSLTLTHAGFANPLATVARSNFQRTRYFWSGDTLYRSAWSVLDQAPSSQPLTRAILTTVSEAQFAYLDAMGHFQNKWPIEGDNKRPLPRAVRITLKISQWGTISQLYVIPAQPATAEKPPPKS